MFKDGKSNARNKTILKMFNLVRVEERARSGFSVVVRAYNEPEILEI